MIYILLSIKTRIETYEEEVRQYPQFQFISYYPLKQGLKPNSTSRSFIHSRIYILLSIKTRIETAYLKIPKWVSNIIYILLSIKTRIETYPMMMERNT